MITHQGPGARLPSRLRRLILTLAVTLCTVVLPGIAVLKAPAVSRVTVWDTGSRRAGQADIAARAGWRPVPTELFALEADPPKAASDPGYYGMEYAFKGDAAVENESLI